MNRPRLHSEWEWCLFSNGYGQLIGEDIAEARDWLAAHPDYAGKIDGDWDTGGPRDHFDATEIFFPDADEADASIPDLRPANNDLRPGTIAQRQLMSELFEGIANTMKRSA